MEKQPETKNIMRKIIKRSLKYCGFVVVLVATIIFGCRCSTSKPTPDPLAGFHFSSLNNLHSNKVIMDDYQDYIQKLPPEERQYVGPLGFLEDDAGQHAVRIEIALNGTDWAHVLIYDKENKRIKAIKYVSGHYRS